MTTTPNFEALKAIGTRYFEELEGEKRNKMTELVMLPSADGGFHSGPPPPPKPVDLEDGDKVGPTGQMTKQRADQVENNAGGFVFQVSDEIRVRRFLIMGTAGGTYYVSEEKLTMDNLEALVEIIEKGNAALILEELYTISLAGRNVKQDPIMFALALCARYRVCNMTKVKQNTPLEKAYIQYLNAMHQKAFEIVEAVCRIPTHLFAFVSYCEVVSKATAKTTGWSKTMRHTIQEWYLHKAAEPMNLAYAVTKYAQREGWSHRDLFRLAHPKGFNETDTEDEHLLVKKQIYRYVVKGDLQTRKRLLPKDDWEEEQPETKYTKAQLDKEEVSPELNMIEAFKRLNKDTTEDQVVEAINKHGLVREHIPSEHLNSVKVWEALLAKMPLIALLRNMSKLQAIEVIKGDTIDEIVAKVTNEEAIRKSKVHPIQVLMSHHIYSQGHGDKGKLTWNPIPQVESALEKAFYTSFKNVEPTGKRFLFAFDVSGSMNMPALGSTITCRKASVAMGMVGLRTEQQLEVVAFSDYLKHIPFTKDWTLKQACDHFDNLQFQQTDCALPMVWAKKEKKEFDVFVVFTDNETYFGEIHPYQALREYRESSGIKDAKLVVMGMATTKFTIADPRDAGMLDIVGFDAAVPQLLSEFVLGKL